MQVTQEWRRARLGLWDDVKLLTALSRLAFTLTSPRLQEEVWCLLWLSPLQVAAPTFAYDTGNTLKAPRTETRQVCLSKPRL